MSKKATKTVYIGERYDGWYAYFEGQNPEQGECICEGLYNRRRTVSRVRFDLEELGQPFEIKDAPWC